MEAAAVNRTLLMNSSVLFPVLLTLSIFLSMYIVISGRAVEIELLQQTANV